VVRERPPGKHQKRRTQTKIEKELTSHATPRQTGALYTPEVLLSKANDPCADRAIDPA
jgi:hypothetical protein